MKVIAPLTTSRVLGLFGLILCIDSMAFPEHPPMSPGITARGVRPKAIAAGKMVCEALGLAESVKLWVIFGADYK